MEMWTNGNSKSYHNPSIIHSFLLSVCVCVCACVRACLMHTVLLYEPVKATLGLDGGFSEESLKSHFLRKGKLLFSDKTW